MTWHSPLPWDRVPAELYTPATMAEVDALAPVMGRSLADLMERAGTEVANLVAALHVHGSRVVCLAGPGNNGGDAYVAARVLQNRGYPVTVVALPLPENASAEAKGAFAAFKGTVLPGAAGLSALDTADVIIDGLFGGGLSRVLTGDAEALVHAANKAEAIIYAIDVPSGVDGGSGAVYGPAIFADRTITFERAKLGHALMPGRRHVGRVNVCEIGMPPRALSTVAPSAEINSPSTWPASLPRLADAEHKYGRGHLFVVTGHMHTTGAARLAALSGLRAGAGLVTLASPRDAMLVNTAHSTTVMVEPMENADALGELLNAGRHKVAVVVGPGLSVDHHGVALLETALRSRAEVVVDAGAIRCIGVDPDRLRPVIEERLAHGHLPVWTPHGGEIRTLVAAFGDAPGKIGCAVHLANSLGVVIEKGADTVIAGAGRRVSINTNAPPWLATAGTGDVLAGTIGAFLAQGLEAFDAARIGVWLHGDAACRAGSAMIADDLIDALRRARAGLDEVLP